ncbi:MAG: hypothetical protein R3Y04_03725 [Rikenellaceae bacterium]
MVLSLIGTALSLGSSIYGGIKSAQSANAQSDYLDNQQRTLDYWYQKEMSEDYLDSDIAKSTISQLDKQNEKLQDAMIGNSVKNNSTAEEKVALASALNSNYADSISKLSVIGENQKDKAESYYLNQSNSISDSQLRNLSQQTAAASQIGSIASSGIGNTLSILESNLNY